VPSGIPQEVVNSDSFLKNRIRKTLLLSRLPNVGEWIIWRDQNFEITKVTHLTEGEVDAIVEMRWRNGS
jgi:hypothetical protein